MDKAHGNPFELPFDSVTNEDLERMGFEPSLMPASTWNRLKAGVAGVKEAVYLLKLEDAGVAQDHIDKVVNCLERFLSNA